MQPPSRLAKLAHRPHLPRRTVRLRLTLLYGGLFLASGAALLTITYLLVRHSTGSFVLVADNPPQLNPDLEGLRLIDPDRPWLGPRRFEDELALVPDQLRELAEQRREHAAAQRSEQLRQLLTQSGIALGLMAVVSIALGWLMAGRVLRPLRTMTARTRRITEHNLHERLALEGPSDELTDLGETIDGLLSRLEAAFEAQRRFVANASHELRTPLSMMRTSLDVAAAKPGRDSPELEALEPKLREGLDRADRLLEEFLALARVQHSGPREREGVSLAEVAETALAEREQAIEARGLRVEAELGASEVTGSRTLLGHLVANAVDNAINHNEPGGWMRVEAGTQSGRAGLVVENGGQRLDEATVAELAQPFRRIGTERVGSENGFGLGLSIVAAIAGAHEGSLELSARSEGGLRLVVDLPSTGRAATVGEQA